MLYVTFYLVTSGGIFMFGDILRELRLDNKMTQEELSSKLGVSRVVLSKYETGDNEPDFAFLVRVSDYFNVSTDYLLGKTKISASNDVLRNLEHSLENNKKLNEILSKFEEDEKFIDLVHLILNKIDKLK